MRRYATALVAAAFVFFGGGASAQGTVTLRDRLVVVTSSSSQRIAQLLLGNFMDLHTGVNPPITHAVGSTAALEMFCSGIGPQTPDIAIVTRRMSSVMRETCATNGVTDVIEVQIGLGAAVLVARRGEVLPPITMRQVWEALAAERPVGDEFVPNPARRWSDIARGFPARDIRVILPQRGSGTRLLFDDLVLEGGCRHVDAIRLLFEAAYRRSKCVTLARDGRVIEVAGDAVPAALLAAPPGTIAVMSYDQLVEAGGNFVPFTLDGVLPSPGSITSLDYEPSRAFYVYAKRQHSRQQQGVGVVRGIREFLLEATSERAFGPSGYLAPAGLVSLSPSERAAQRRIAERQILMSR